LPASRAAGAADLEPLTQTLWLAFHDDPLWSWAFPDRAKLEGWWRFLIRSALRYPCTWVAGDYAAVAVWIPPGGIELTEDEQELVEPLFEELAGRRAPALMELLERFEASHPTERPHYYLSLLGTHPDHRGKGYGMGLVETNLRQIDAEGMPAYLESSNPANDRRYERLGFARIGSFSTPDGEHALSTMWREPR
jgi:GNAT superfamily N-acetyltransferase